MDRKFLLILFVSTISSCLSFNFNGDGLVIVKEPYRNRIVRSPKESDDFDIDEILNIPKIYAMHIQSTVKHRYAQTLVTSKVKNMGDRAQEAVFAVILPEKAFISKFVMAIDGKDYEAYVKEKEEAKGIYKQAIEQGLGAAHIAASARDSNRFTVSVNVEPSSKATFHLTYEQLLERKDNKYELVINIHPKQPVKDLFVDVHINESLPLKFVHAPPIRSGNDIRDASGDLDPRARIEVNEKSAYVTFRPSIKRQKEIGHLLHENIKEGLSGQFIVQYDVERSQRGGEVLLEDGYFVHFFAPPHLKPLPKNVYFILDTSGSMYGTAILQLKQAMNKIMDELKPGDKFSLIEFNSDVKVLGINTNNYETSPSESIHWTEDGQTIPKSYEVTQNNIDVAKDKINSFDAAGGTNIAGAFKVTLHLIDLEKENINNPKPLIIFLTDGEATVGITDSERIVATVSEQNKHKTPIFCLSFGSFADRNLLQKLSLRNHGFSRHIYEGADASLQLEDFYSHISSPVMNNITFKYVSDAKDVTKTTYPILFEGEELVVTGKIDKQFPTPPTIHAQGADGPIDLVPEVTKPIAKLERLWAYVTIQQLLEDKEIAKNATEIEQKALDIALKYSFVTPVSSMVVVKPNASSVDVGLEVAEPTSKNSNSLPTAITANRFSPLMVSQSSHPLMAGIPGPSMYLPFTTTRPYPTTTTTPPTTTITTTHTTTTTRPPKRKLHTIEQLKHILPWLNKTLENNVLHTEKGDFKIGLYERSEDYIICPVTPRGGTGYCRHLHECPEILRYITNVYIFEQYHCELEGFAAICCPPEKPMVN